MSLNEFSAAEVVGRYDLRLPWIVHLLPFIFLFETAVFGALGGLPAIITPALMTLAFLFMPVVVAWPKRKFIPWSYSYQIFFRYKCDFREVGFAPHELYKGTPMEKRYLTYMQLAEILEYCEKHIPSTKWYFNNGVLKLSKRSQLIKLRLVFPFLNENFYGRLFKDK